MPISKLQFNINHSVVNQATGDQKFDSPILRINLILLSYPDILYGA